MSTNEYNVHNMYSSTSFAPSKRTIKNRSGRSARKQANGAVFLQLPGQTRVPHTEVGPKNEVRAIYDFDALWARTLNTPTTTPGTNNQHKQGAIIVPNEKGWNSDGTPNRL